MPKRAAASTGKVQPDEIPSATAPNDDRYDVTRAWRISLIASLVAYFIFQVLWITGTPINMQSVGNSLPGGGNRQLLVGTGPDEPQHYLYILSIAESGRLPRPLPEMRHSPDEFVSHEAQHPPLFYVIAAGLRDLALPLGDRGVWYVLRGFGILCGALALWLLSRMALIAFPSRPFIGIAMPPFLAMLPMYDYMTSELSNFPLELVFTSAGLLLLLTIARGKRPLNIESGLMLALAFGLAAITRQTSALWIPAILIVFGYTIRAANGAEQRRKAIRGAIVFLAVYAVFAVPWFVYMYANDGSFMFRSDYRPLLGNISLGHYLANPMARITVPNMWRPVECPLGRTVLWYVSSSWMPLWITQFAAPEVSQRIDVFQTFFLIPDIAVVVLLMRHWQDNGRAASPEIDPAGRVLLWAFFITIVVTVAMIWQQQLYVDIQMFLYSGRYILSVVAACALLLLFAISTRVSGSLRTAILACAIFFAVMLVFDAWIWFQLHEFYTGAVPTP